MHGRSRAGSGPTRSKWTAVPSALAVAAIAALLAVRPSGEASAAWQPNGFQYAGPTARGQFFVPIPDGTGGWYVGWQDHRASKLTSEDVRVQRITPTGEIPLGWPADGLIIGGLPDYEGFQDLTLDAQGGVILTWRQDNSDLLQADLYAQRINSDGTVAAGWPPGGAPVSRAPSLQEPARVASDGGGGAFFVWTDYRTIAVDGHVRVHAQHLTATGQVAPGWPQDGLQLCMHESGVFRSLVPDSQGGFFVAWADERRGFQTPDAIDTYGLHVLSDGALAPGWQPNGNLLAAGRVIRDLVPDGSGGFYVTSLSLREDINFGGWGEDEYWVSRWTPSGTPAPGWDANGVQVRSGTETPGWMVATSDAMGGMIAA